MSQLCWHGGPARHPDAGLWPCGNANCRSFRALQSSAATRPSAATRATTRATTKLTLSVSTILTLTTGGTPFCFRTVPDQYLVKPFGFSVERRANFPDCCKCQEYLKVDGVIGPDKAQLGGGSYWNPKSLEIESSPSFPMEHLGAICPLVVGGPVIGFMSL